MMNNKAGRKPVKLPPLGKRASPNDNNVRIPRSTLSHRHKSPAKPIKYYKSFPVLARLRSNDSACKSLSTATVRISIEACTADENSVTEADRPSSRQQFFPSYTSAGSEYSKSTSSPECCRRSHNMKKQSGWQDKSESASTDVRRHTPFPDFMSEEVFARCCDWLDCVEACRGAEEYYDVTHLPPVQWTW